MIWIDPARIEMDLVAVLVETYLFAGFDHVLEVAKSLLGELLGLFLKVFVGAFEHFLANGGDVDFGFEAGESSGLVSG